MRVLAFLYTLHMVGSTLKMDVRALFLLVPYVHLLDLPAMALYPALFDTAALTMILPSRTHTTNLVVSVRPRLLIRS